MPEVLIAITTFPEMESARRIASLLVEEALVACANLIPGAESVYRWQNQLERSQEVVALLKTTTEVWERLERRLKELHPYQCPELVALPLAHGSPAYLQWVAQNCPPKAAAADAPSKARPQT